MVVDPWRNLFRSNVVLRVVEVVEIIDFSVSRFFSLNVVSHLLDPADFTFLINKRQCSITILDKIFVDFFSN